MHVWHSFSKFSGLMFQLYKIRVYLSMHTWKGSAITLFFFLIHVVNIRIRHCSFMPALCYRHVGTLPSAEGRKKKLHIWKEGGNSGKFGCLTKCTSFPPMTNVWFLSFKKVFQQCDYDKSAQIACDTERRMNGHVKSMSFQQFMELATSKFSNFILFRHQENN